MKYRTIVADPPWRYEGFLPAQWKGRVWHTQMPYPMLDVESISSLPVRDLTDPTGARLFLWTTNRYLPDSFGVIRAWGFQYKQTLTWRKTGNPPPFGGSLAPNAEFLLVAIRGKVERRARLPEAVIEGPAAAAIGSHSRKPELFLDLIEQVSPGPYLELFARRQRLGWDTWGDEALEHVQLGGTA